MFLDTGITQIVDFLNTDITHGALGTSGTTAAVTDTGLGAEYSSSVTTVSNSVSGKQLTTTLLKPSTVGVGVAFREYCIRDSSSTSGNYYIRFVIPSSTATAVEDWTIKCRFSVEQQ